MREFDYKKEFGVRSDIAVRVRRPKKMQRYTSRTTINVEMQKFLISVPEGDRTGVLREIAKIRLSEEGFPVFTHLFAFQCDNDMVGCLKSVSESSADVIQNSMVDSVVAPYMQEADWGGTLQSKLS